MATGNQAGLADLNVVPMETPLGRRVSVVGGGGKSTLAKAISAKTGLSYIELDALFWLPNWGESSTEELKSKVTAAIDAAPDGWVADGHYWSKMGDHLIRHTDMVIWIDLPWRIGFWRVLKRSIQRAHDKRKICGDNTESWRKLFSKDALWLYWIVQRKAIIARDRRLAIYLPAGIPVIHLESARELNRFYETNGLERAG